MPGAPFLFGGASSLSQGLSLPDRVMSSQLRVLCKQHPSLVVELSKPLLEFSGTVSNIQTKEDLFIHVVRRYLHVPETFPPSPNCPLVLFPPGNLNSFLNSLSFPEPARLHVHLGCCATKRGGANNYVPWISYRAGPWNSRRSTQ